MGRLTADIVKTSCFALCVGLRPMSARPFGRLDLHQRGMLVLLDLIAKAAPLLIGVEGKTASRFEDSDGFLFCEYAGRDCGVEDDLLVCHDGFLLAFVVVLAVIT